MMTSILGIAVALSIVAAIYMASKTDKEIEKVEDIRDTPVNSSQRD